MRVIGVIDLRAGTAVHARGGNRERYQAVERAATHPIAGDALALARFYRDECGVRDVYVADLDAIAGLPLQHRLVAELARLDVEVWLDAGAASVVQAREARAAGASQVVVGLETLPSFQVLADICAAIGRSGVVFSLDLHEGRPLVLANSPPCHSVDLIAAQAVQVGIEQMIVLDLARVGAEKGIDVDAVARIAGRVAGCRLYAGGGVVSVRDLDRLRAAGAAGVLLATALIDGRLSRADLHSSLTL